MSCHSWIKQEPEEKNEIKFNPGLNQKPLQLQDFDQRQIKEESYKDTSVQQEIGIFYNNNMSNEVCLIVLLLVVVAQNRFDDYYGLITSKLNLNSLF